MKQMKWVLIGAVMLAQPIYPKSESGWIKKTIHVSWHAVQLAAGLSFLNQWHRMTGGQCDPCSKRYGFDCDRGPYAVAALTLIWYGLRGLDQELHLRDQFKK